MQRVLRVFDSFEDAEAADLDEWCALSGEERMRIGEEMRLDAFPGGREPFVRRLRVRELGSEEE